MSVAEPSIRRRTARSQHVNTLCDGNLTSRIRTGGFMGIENGYAQIYRAACALIPNGTPHRGRLLGLYCQLEMSKSLSDWTYETVSGYRQRIKKGEQLISKHELATRMGCSRNTLKKDLAFLARLKLIAEDAKNYVGTVIRMLETVAHTVSKVVSRVIRGGSNQGANIRREENIKTRVSPVEPERTGPAVMDAEVTLAYVDEIDRTEVPKSREERKVFLNGIRWWKS